MVGKLILYAPHPLVAPDITPADAGRDSLYEVPPVADIPWPGTHFDAGEPVMTLLAAGENLAECRSRLLELEQTWTKRLGMAGGGTLTDEL